MKFKNLPLILFHITFFAFITFSHTTVFSQGILNARSMQRSTSANGDSVPTFDLELNSQNQYKLVDEGNLYDRTQNNLPLNSVRHSFSLNSNLIFNQQTPDHCLFDITIPQQLPFSQPSNSSTFLEEYYCEIINPFNFALKLTFQFPQSPFSASQPDTLILPGDTFRFEFFPASGQIERLIPGMTLCQIGVSHQTNQNVAYSSIPVGGGGNAIVVLEVDFSPHQDLQNVSSYAPSTSFKKNKEENTNNQSNAAFAEDELCALEIYSFSGKRVFQEDSIRFKDWKKSLKKLNKGTYLIQIYNQNGKFYQKTIRLL